MVFASDSLFMKPTMSTDDVLASTMTAGTNSPPFSQFVFASKFFIVVSLYRYLVNKLLILELAEHRYERDLLPRRHRLSLSRAPPESLPSSQHRLRQ